MSVPWVAPEAASRSERLPRRVVALGGGTGLPVVLRGLRTLIRGEDRTALTAVVTMSDDGGSSGRLRRTMGHPPPGDIRNCLVALSENEELLASLFQHRFTSSRELSGHTAGNLILVALAEQMGGFLKAVEASSMVLRTAGRILPATQDDVRLDATLEDPQSRRSPSVSRSAEGVAQGEHQAPPGEGSARAGRRRLGSLDTLRRRGGRRARRPPATAN